MHTFIKPILRGAALVSLTVLLSPASANSDKIMQDMLLRQRESKQMDEHEGHQQVPSNGPDFKGVYYGYYPCNEADCAGIKITLSLKRSNNYLLVRQPAKQSSREFYEKGKFAWNEDTKTVVLIHKDNTPGGQYRIVNDDTLIQLNPDGTAVAGDQDDYTLKRGDSVKSREMHIH
jgi:NlpE N-terminal domain